GVSRVRRRAHGGRGAGADAQRSGGDGGDGERGGRGSGRGERERAPGRHGQGEPQAGRVAGPGCGRAGVRAQRRVAAAPPRAASAGTSAGGKTGSSGAAVSRDGRRALARTRRVWAVSARTRISFRPGGLMHLAAVPRSDLPRRKPLRFAPLLAGAALLLAPWVTMAQQPGPGLARGIAQADSIVAEAVAQERVPGAVLLVAQNGRVLHERAYGYAQLYELREGRVERLAEPRPLHTGTLFDLASVTKVMATTFAVMLLVDRGALDLDAPVGRYLPELRDSPHT